MSAAPLDDALEDLIHDVNSKCSSLKEAAALLRKASPEEFSELLALMAQETTSLAQSIADYNPRKSSR